MLWPVEGENCPGLQITSKIMIPYERKARSERWCMKEGHLYGLALNFLHKFHDLNVQIQQPECLKCMSATDG